MKKLMILVAAAALSCGTAFAQDQPTTSAKPNGSTETAASEPVRNDTNYGWIGLLGLAGLAGLMRRREPNVETRNISEPRVVGGRDEIRRAG